MSIGKSIRRSLILATVLVAFCIAGGSVYAADQVKVHMINVGNADSFLVEYNGHYALIDGGRATNAGKYKNGKDIDGDCALDKYSTLEKALAGKLSAGSTTKFYRDRNLFSFYEHFDNDMKELTRVTHNNKNYLATTILTASESYATDFNRAVTARQAYDRELEEYREECKEWAEYDEALEAYEHLVQVWADYDKALAAYKIAEKEYPAKLKAYQEELKAWQERNPDGQEDPEDPMPVEPEKPIPPTAPASPRPTEAQRPQPPAGTRPQAAPVNKSGLDNAAWALYQNKKSVFDGIKTRASATKYASSAADVEAFRKFMELQRESSIKKEDPKSPLYRYYTALGYRYVYKQIDSYFKSSGYVNGAYNDCLTYLNKRGVKTIDYLILTHSHVDHVGALGAVLASDRIKVNNIIYNGTAYGSGNFRVFEHEMLDAQKEGSRVIKADDDKNNTFTLGGKVKFTQLGDTDRIPAYTREPNQGSTKDKKFMNHIINNQSLVYRMDFDGTSMLFTGDAEGQKDGNGYNRQADILSKHKALVNVDVYKAAHHCHNNASNASFNSAMSPYYVLASCGKKNEPHKKARKALSGADIWTTKGNGDAIVASLSRNSFRIVNGAGNDITRRPAYSHTVSTKSSFGTPNLSKAAFKASGKSVSALRNTSTRIGYYNPPKTGNVKVKVSPGWFYDRVQYQLCAGDRGMSNARWKSGSTATISGAFRGTVYFRLSNKYGRSIVCKTDGFETRTAVAAARGGRAVLTGYNDVMIDWYPVKGAKKYKVWYKKGKKWKSKGTTKDIYKSIKNVPSGKRVQFRIKPVGGSGTAYVSVVTLKKAAKPTVGKAGSVARVSWKAVAGGSGYQVAVNSKVKATTRGIRYASVKVATGKKLKYKVRAYTVSNGRTIYGPWSKVRKYKL